MIVRHRFSVIVKRSRYVQTEDGKGVKWEDLQSTSELVEVEVDFQKIANQIGPRACRSKSGKSKYMSGAVIVRKVR